jgi:hypothetical protein
MKITLPKIPDSKRTPQVTELLGMIERLCETVKQQREEITILKDEVQILKGQKKRPRFKPSKLDKDTDEKPNKTPENNKRPGSAKRTKNDKLTVHQDKIIQPDVSLPDSARFKGYRDYIVQELNISPDNTRYRLAYYQLPDGSTVTATLPDEVAGQHFGVKLRSYILYQYHQCQVTQPLLLEQLTEWGIAISSGQLNRLLTEKHTEFHSEKQDLLKKGLNSRGYVTSDDTGARHQGKNGFVTHIGNEWFAWFKSTASKSRINFLSLLQADAQGYRVNEAALNYMQSHSLPSAQFGLLSVFPVIYFEQEGDWLRHLSQLGINQPRHIKISTEGALLGAILEESKLEQLAIVSDGAGQFNVLQHGLCWVHAERLIHKLQPLNDEHREDIERVRNEIWVLYKGLKHYKHSPDEAQKHTLSHEFDRIFSQKTRYELLNQQLKRLKKLKAALLLVLERPEIPIHTNGSENDLREQVKRRKVSGGTRSELGRECRDTFSSLKKTCRKLGVSFWDYLMDRLARVKMIPLLGDLVLKKAQAAPTY